MTDPPSVNVSIYDRQRVLLQGSTPHQYKELAGGDALALHVYPPHSPAASGGSPAIAFFFGGGLWERGEVSQFAPQCLHFTARGMVAILADYRLGRSRGATPADGVADARDAVAWIVANAGMLGIDPERLVLGGASSGAHVVLAASMAPEGGDGSLACDPAALALFSPIVNTVRPGVQELFGGKREARLFSPLHLVRKRLTPAIMFHGTDDRVQPVGEVEMFARKLEKKRNHCELNVFNNERSSYFNFNVNPGLYEATLNMVDDFLVRGGVLDGDADGSATTRLDSWR